MLTWKFPRTLSPLSLKLANIIWAADSLEPSLFARTPYIESDEGMGKEIDISSA